jgi:hypothetical protein
MKNIKKLETEFTGVGEVRNFNFLQLYSTNLAYIYKVSNKDVHYECFLKKSVPLCIDFKNKIYSEIDFKEVYPKSKDFGVWAWTFKKYEDALNKITDVEMKLQTNL